MVDSDEQVYPSIVTACNLASGPLIISFHNDFDKFISIISPVDLLSMVLVVALLL